MRQAEAEVAVPQSEQADQALPGARRLLAKRRKFGGGLGVEHLLPRLVELVQRSGLAKFLCELRSRFRGRLGLRQQTDELVGGDRAIVGASDVGCEAQCLLGSAQLRLLESLTGNLRAERQGCQRKNVANDLSFDLVRTISGNPRDRKRRIGRQALPDKIGFGQREFVVGGLQTPVVQQRDLYGGVHRQISAKKALHEAFRPLCVVLEDKCTVTVIPQSRHLTPCAASRPSSGERDKIMLAHPLQDQKYG